MLTNFPYHTSGQFAKMFVGFLAVLLIVFVTIGHKTMKAALMNPVKSLWRE